MQHEKSINNMGSKNLISIEPRVLIVRVLEACNAGCFMCDFAFSKDSYRFSHEDAITLTKQLKGTEIKVVRLTGGEPLILSDLPEILLTFKKAGLLTSIITNGFYLPERASLFESRLLDHVIISIDGATAEKHDRYRRLPSLYNNICGGIRLLKEKSPDTILRVNTVVGKHNLKDLKKIYDNLCDLGVNQWSIIPLKRSDSTWGGFSVEQLKEEFELFKEHVSNNLGHMELLGHSLQWAGRNDAEIFKNWQDQRSITPKGECLLVEQVRYYTPKEGFVFPCNCIPHRTEGAELGERWSENSVSTSGLAESRSWLKKFGPSKCMGCEPINAALGEGLINLNETPLGF